LTSRQSAVVTFNNDNYHISVFVCCGALSVFNVIVMFAYSCFHIMFVFDYLGGIALAAQARFDYPCTFPHTLICLSVTFVRRI